MSWDRRHRQLVLAAGVLTMTLIAAACGTAKANWRDGLALPSTSAAAGKDPLTTKPTKPKAGARRTTPTAPSTNKPSRTVPRSSASAPDPPSRPTPTSRTPRTTAPHHTPRPTTSTRPRPTEHPTPTRPPSTAAEPAADRPIVAYYGAGTHLPVLGVLGQSDPEVAWSRLESEAAHYERPGRPVQPAFELIATIASATPGPDGTYRRRQPASVLDRYLKVVRRHHGLLILDIQPGRSDFLTEAKALRPWLLQPDVGLALDPEWRMGATELPGKVIGSVSAAEVNTVSAWLEELVVNHHLPTKVFLLHKFRATMIQDEPALANRSHLREVVNMDGFGTPHEKLSEYAEFAAATPFQMGLKLFYHQDIDLLAPSSVARLDPVPDLIDYQ